MRKFQIIQILMLVVFFLGMGSQALSAPQGLVQDAYTIFEQNCFSCHAAGATYAAFLLIEDYSALTAENGPVVPGDPDASRLYKRLLGEGGAQMPLGGPPLSEPEMETIKDWILAGAPDWAVPSLNHAVSEKLINFGDTFMVNISAETAFDLAKWQLDIAFDPAALEALRTCFKSR